MVEMLKQLIVKDEQSSNSAVNTKKPRNNQDYISSVPDDVLIKIFLRLSNIQSVSQCSRVRKSWFSLISLHKQLLYSSHDTIVFNFYNESNPLFEPFIELFPQSLRTEKCYLDFLPGWPRVTIRASCDDLLLASSSLQDYFICNTLTREWIALPKAPPIPSSYEPCGYGLASDPNKSLHNYRAVVVHTTYFQREWGNFTFDVFCSETGRWTELIYKQICLPFALREPRVSMNLLNDLVVTRNGALYWLDGNELICVGIISFHPYTKTCRYIEFPPSARNWALNVYRPTKWDLQLGVVRGRLRLLLRSFTSPCVNFEIWELDDDDGEDDDSSYSWVLVHKVSTEKNVFVLAFHPSDTDVVFVMCEREILRLRLRENEFDKVGEIPRRRHVFVSPDFMKVFPLKHYSTFPTPLTQVTASAI